VQQTKQIIITSPVINTPTVAGILSSRWEEYIKTHKVRKIELKEVEKTLSCRISIFIYYCLNCGARVYQMLGCNSRLCTNCGKRYNDQWAKSLAHAMFRVPHRHFVLSIPSQLWPYLRENRKLWKDYMDSAIETCADYFPKIMDDPSIIPGVITILHPFGKDMKFQPHLHIIVTEGGFNGRGQFMKRTFFPARPFAKCWQYHVLDKLQKAGIPYSLITEMYESYDGFYVWVHRKGRIINPKQIAKYIGRYVRHPAIANSRITGFDGKTVDFYYEEEKEDGIKERHDVSMPVDEFITSLIQHIPDRQFKMVRYYGAYARKNKKKFGKYATQSGITNGFQDILYMPGRKSKPVCPHCGGMLQLWGYQTLPPPGDFFHWTPKKKDLVSWITMN